MKPALQEDQPIVNGNSRTNPAYRIGRRVGVGALYVLIDTIVIFAAFYVVYLARFAPEVLLHSPFGYLRPEYLGQPPFRDHFEIAGLMWLFLIALLQKNGLYVTPRGKGFSAELAGLANALFLTLVFGLTVSFLLQQFAVSRLVIFAYIVVLFPLLAGWRYLKRKGVKYLVAHGYGRTKALIIGAGRTGTYLAAALQAAPELGVDVVGFLDDHLQHLRQRPFQVTVLGTLDDLKRVVAGSEVQDVYITIPSERDKVMRLAAFAGELGLNVHIVPDLFDLLVREVEFESVGSLTLLRLFQPTLSGGELLVKRAEDLVLASLLLAVFSPLLAVVAVAIKLDSPGPVIYKQQRLGLNGRPFWLYKFRSMYVNADEGKHRQAAKQWVNSSTPMDGESGIYKLTNDDRITRVGRIIRKFNVDEIPQFWNVIRGEMAVVGPRPPLPYEYEEYQEYHKKRLAVKPGITGLWQVSGLHRLSFEEMVLLDLCYINEWSVWLDLEIVFRTISLVLLGRGL